MDDFQVDVLVVGAGNAAACAALAARETGASVAMLEAAPEEERGGNSTYTAGAMRVVFHGVDDLVQLYDLTEDEKRDVDFGRYTADEFLDDMGRVTNYRCDPELTDILIGRSFETLKWMRSKGVRFQPSYGRQAFKVNGKYKFWGGLAVEAWGGGPGLVDLEHKAAVKAGIPIHYQTAAVSLIEEDGVVRGVIARHKGRKVRIGAKAVVLACGGFESNAEMRTRYLGPTWDLAKVRGTRFNTGAGINMALAIGAKAHGNWSGGHAVGWDMNAPEFGDLEVGDNFQKHSYPLGIMVNANGVRFVDEGADFRNYTYAKYGAVILSQPQQFAWQIFDSKVLDRLRDEYRIKRMTKVRADTIEELAKKLEGVDEQQFLKTIKEWNAAVMTEVPFNPAVKDGRSTRGLAVPKSNWANTIDEPPFEAYAVTCGLTFTFGGLKITNEGEVESTDGPPIPGLFAAGELVGGLFYHNYPGGTGLVSGAVLGKLAGDGAGRYVKGRNRAGTRRRSGSRFRPGAQRRAGRRLDVDRCVERHEADGDAIAGQGPQHVHGPREVLERIGRRPQRPVVERPGEIVPMDGNDEPRLRPGHHLVPIPAHEIPALLAERGDAEEDDVGLDAVVHARNEVAAGVDDDPEALVVDQERVGAAFLVVGVRHRRSERCIDRSFRRFSTRHAERMTGLEGHDLEAADGELLAIPVDQADAAFGKPFPASDIGRRLRADQHGVPLPGDTGGIHRVVIVRMDGEHR